MAGLLGIVVVPENMEYNVSGLFSVKVNEGTQEMLANETMAEHYCALFFSVRGGSHGGIPSVLRKSSC